MMSYSLYVVVVALVMAPMNFSYRVLFGSRVKFAVKLRNINVQPTRRHLSAKSVTVDDVTSKLIKKLEGEDDKSSQTQAVSRPGLLWTCFVDVYV